MLVIKYKDLKCSLNKGAKMFKYDVEILKNLRQLICILKKQ